jgi:hypothetical protein
LSFVIRLIQVSDMNTRYAIALITAVLLPATTVQAADSYQCSMGDQQRRIEILSEPGTSVPCEVHYYKDANAPDDKQVLWRAKNQEGYCESQTEAFIAKLEGWGWDCGQGGQATSAPDAGTGDAAEDAVEGAAEDAVDDAAEDAVEEGMPRHDDTDDLQPAAVAQ